MTVTPGIKERSRARPWLDRFIAGSLVGRDAAVPDWLPGVYEAFESTVLTEGYPCYFGQNAVRGGDIYITALVEEQRSQLPVSLTTFIRLSRSQPRRRNNLAVFFRPAAEPPDHATFQRTCWDTLQWLHDHDPNRGRAGLADDTDHPLWEFPFADTLFFVVGLSPSYRQRRSRNVCRTIVMLFQPRDVFEDANGVPIGARARAQVRERLLRWDALPVHPDLGTYGSSHNREWRQYFLSDDDRPAGGTCPLALHKAKVSMSHPHQGEEPSMLNYEMEPVQEGPRREHVIQALSEKVDDFMQSCEFFVAFREEEVSKQTADRFLLSFDHLVASFPPLIAVGLAGMSEAGRVVLAKNLYQECGDGDLTRTHHAIYRKFLDSAGLDWRTTLPDHCTKTWRTMLWHHTLNAVPASSVGAIAAGEFLAQPALGRIFAVLKPLYPEADIEYFTSHLELETEHVEEIAELIAAECRNPADYEQMMSGFEASLQCWGDWFRSITRLVFESGAQA